MNRIDKLILKARAVVSPSRELIVALIERNGDFWTAEAHLSDGAAGHAPTVKRSAWATLDKAVEHIRAMATEYPNSRDVAIIVDDLG